MWKFITVALTLVVAYESIADNTPDPFPLPHSNQQMYAYDEEDVISAANYAIANSAEFEVNRFLSKTNLNFCKPLLVRKASSNLDKFFASMEAVGFTVPAEEKSRLCSLFSSPNHAKSGPIYEKFCKILKVIAVTLFEPVSREFRKSNVGESGIELIKILFCNKCTALLIKAYWVEALGLPHKAYINSMN
ncbi:MAG: hypothetical protein LBT90_03490 [Holosporaceae bacterium]|nr:hypothetical protein [Holosporaceae bacterium]